jgi:hypothetical protein
MRRGRISSLRKAKSDLSNLRSARIRYRAACISAYCRRGCRRRVRFVPKGITWSLAPFSRRSIRWVIAGSLSTKGPKAVILGPAGSILLAALTRQRCLTGIQEFLRGRADTVLSQWTLGADRGPSPGIIEGLSLAHFRRSSQLNLASLLIATVTTLSTPPLI